MRRAAAADPAGILARRWGAVVIGCGGRKQWAVVPACELYTGSYFRALRLAACAVDAGERRILSGRYGLVAWDEPLYPYEQRIDQAGAVSRVELAGQAAELRGPVLLLAGRAYADRLSAVRPGDLVWPFAGMRGIGDQLAWLRELRELAGRGQA